MTPKTGEPPQLRVAYVTMRFPQPSETFASNEVRVLTGLGAEITVHSMRRAHVDGADLERQRRVEGIAKTYNGVRASLRGALVALAQPRTLLEALSWIVRRNRGQRRDLWSSLLLLPRAFGIVDAIGRDRPDVVHMYWGHYPSLVGYLVQTKYPRIVTSIAIVAYDLRREYAGTIDVAQRADVVRTHAEVNRPHIVRFTGVPADRIHVIYNGVDLEELARIASGHAKVRHRIVTVARLVETKGTDRVLEAFAQVRERWPDATLVVVGSGPDLDRLTALRTTLGLGDEVRFVGYLPHDEAVEEMAKAEVFVLLSRMQDERLPNVVKEGMACGCVCVTTPTPGIDELVRHGVDGFVVSMDDAVEAFEAIDRVFSGRVDAAAMTGAASDHVREAFDVDRTAPRYLELWHEARAQRGARAQQHANPHAQGVRAEAK